MYGLSTHKLIKREKAK